jgi:pantoate--beta-alanine ligase
MKIIFNKKKLINFIKNQKNLGFVPTMGGIHAGHISLINRSVKECEKTIVTIFVNKPQFNKKSDYKKYPKNLKKDILKLKKTKTDFLYLPTMKQIYPHGINKKIKISQFSKKLCGKFRPGHFEAVVDVLDRFVKLINPKKVFLGEKDMQQLLIVNQFIKKKYPDKKIVACKTIRDKNGVALSSRNFLLSKKEIHKASNIFKIVYKMKNKLIKNKFNFLKLKEIIYSYGVNKIDYIDLLDINKVIKPHKKNKKYKVFIAYYLGSTRLIDNI